MSDDDPESLPPGPTRRKFLLTSGTSVAASLVAAYVPASAKSAAAVSDSAPISAGPSIDGAVPITLRINGKDHKLNIDPRTTLLDCIRETVALTGTKKGCVLSCLNLALMHDGEEITTVEGLGTPEAMHPMQASFLACDAYQCGYCTSGQIMSAVALLKEPCGPDAAAVKELMSGNICRCGAYANIVDAIQQVRKRA